MRRFGCLLLGITSDLVFLPRNQGRYRSLDRLFTCVVCRGQLPLCHSRHRLCHDLGIEGVPRLLLIPKKKLTITPWSNGCVIHQAKPFSCLSQSKPFSIKPPLHEGHIIPRNVMFRRWVLVQTLHLAQCLQMLVNRDRTNENTIPQ
jgi:hypothetical protein